MLIQGKNGSGKTTIIKLLLRLYEDYSGEILINHDEIRTLCLADIRNRIGVLILDEPTTFLDQKSKDGILNFIESSRNMILIVISHDTDLVKHFSNVLYLQ